MNKKIIWGVVIVVLIAILAYAAVVKTSTANWETYQGQENIINFKYPTTWEVKSVSDSEIIVFNTSEVKKPATDTRKEGVTIKFDQLECKATNGWNDLSFGYDSYKTVCMKESSGRMREINMVAFSSKAKKIEDKILNSISTTEQGKVSTFDWKTYKNDKFGFEFNYPQNYVTLNRDTSNGFIAMFRDQSKVFPNPDVANLIMIDVSSARKEVLFENYIKKYPRVNSNTNRPYEFTPRTLGKNTFYYTLTERFEGTLSFMYCILNNDTVSCFHSESNGVDWTNQDLDVDSDSTHAALRSILATLKFTSPTNTVQSKEQKLISTSREVLTALKNKDYNKLETLSSKDGLSFNEYPDSLDLNKNDIGKSAISEIPTNTIKYMWGYTDGKGDEIRLTVSDYISKWIYNRDYINAPKIVVNQIAYPQGNTPNNIATYSQGRNYVAFHFDGFDPKYGGMDWTTIYLIFDEENGNYMLRGIVKANWTI